MYMNKKMEQNLLLIFLEILLIKENVLIKEEHNRIIVSGGISMSISSIQLKEKYINWLENEISVKNIGEYFEITSSFLDRYNDYLHISAKLENDNEIFFNR